MLVEIEKITKFDRVRHCFFPETLPVSKIQHTVCHSRKKNGGKNKLTCLLRFNLDTNQCKARA